MAEHLASIFGTEKDRRPDMRTPGLEIQGQNMDPRRVQQHFEDFFEDMYDEFIKYGELESLNVCDNLADHMVGNVYVQFQEEEQAAAALQAVSGRFYAGRPILVDFSPVTDFREATCRQYEENMCNRGGYCNFMHLKKIGRDLRRKLFGHTKKYGRSRSRSLSRNRSYSPRKEFDKHDYQYDWTGGKGYDRQYDGRDDYRMDCDRRLRGGGYRRSPSGHRRSRSPGSWRIRGSPVEGSPERRARIEQWNRERENKIMVTHIHRDMDANWNDDDPQEARNGNMHIASANRGPY